jgi:hypothetical protein
VRKHGLTIDDLLDAELVIAGGEQLLVDEGSHPDLFWAIRGGGGNFGVATKFPFRLHELPTIVGGDAVAAGHRRRRGGVRRRGAGCARGALHDRKRHPGPPMPFVPEEHHGRIMVMGLMAYAGDAEAGQRALAPFRALATPIADLLRPMPYPEVYPPEQPGFHPIVSAHTMLVTTSSAVRSRRLSSSSRRPTP